MLVVRPLADIGGVVAPVIGIEIGVGFQLLRGLIDEIRIVAGIVAAASARIRLRGETQ
jgi:hypothetical protein